MEQQWNGAPRPVEANAGEHAAIGERVRPPLENERGRRQRIARELQLRLLEMIVVEMAVAARPDELADVRCRSLRTAVRSSIIG